MNDRGRHNLDITIALLLIALAALVSLRCGGSSAAETTVRATDGHPAPAPVAVPHGDHSPHHGGAVLMLRDLHYEIVFEPSGGVAVYFTDAVRNDLPASVVSAVYLEIDRPKHRVERIELAIDANGEAWTGKGTPMTKADADAVVHVAFTFQGEAESVDLPYHLYWKS
jgi:hypothetical protein